MAPLAITLDNGPLDVTHEKAGLVLMNSQAISQPSESGILHRDLHQPPQTVIHASGNYLQLDNSQKILDATGGAAVACLGHGDERVQKAMVAQMREVSYCHSLFFSSSSAEALGKELVDGTKGTMARAFIVCSGSEAMEAAMKLARQYFMELSPPGISRTKFIARRESYHGNTLGALSAGGHLARRRLFEPLLHDNVSFVSACNEYRGKRSGESINQFVSRLADELDREFLVQGPESVCAFMAEPVVGAASGCVPSVPGYFKAIREVCDRYGALLIFDEVMCGMGRTGTLHAWEQEGVVPDIQTIGKGLGGGYAPIAGVLMTQRIVDSLDKGSGAFSHGQTYQGHPVSCAAALAVQQIIREEDMLANVREMGSYLSASLRKALGDHPNVGNIRGRGLFYGIELVRDKNSKTPFDPKDGVAAAIHSRGMRQQYGISLYPGTGCVDGVLGDHIMLAPPFNVTRGDIDAIVRLTARVFEDEFARAPEACERGWT